MEIAYPMFEKDSRDHTMVEIDYDYRSTICGIVIDPKWAWVAFFFSSDTARELFLYDQTMLGLWSEDSQHVWMGVEKFFEVRFNLPTDTVAFDCHRHPGAY
ncbi:uncharacterized protein MELLADRAFT_114292 [Melampsora larici-populina 98AG31]|uniref:Uncharacterized protein n=1 Tax=Melampsora larici-populina (strain 98AG31 / pathotype 3-4-7) TaxID=747676 RepID=F4SCX5_MELLP|nr:uncharacterized protein MELLADRAFT_114292 [Melampsora larici-populina 98AG31]EGF97504.1 hypothetical protein MELLADRAFT_114292 [Melampsora larici-populina 98AG31]